MSPARQCLRLQALAGGNVKTTNQMLKLKKSVWKIENYLTLKINLHHPLSIIYYPIYPISI